MRWSVKSVWGISVSTLGMWHEIHPCFGFTGQRLGRGLTAGVHGPAGIVGVMAGDAGFAEWHARHFVS